MGECRQQKHTQHAPSTKTECDYLNGWIKKNGHIRKNLTQKWWTPEIKLGNAEEEEEVRERKDNQNKHSEFLMLERFWCCLNFRLYYSVEKKKDSCRLHVSYYAQILRMGTNILGWCNMHIVYVGYGRGGSADPQFQIKTRKCKLLALVVLLLSALLVLWSLFITVVFIIIIIVIIIVII